jgi:hypothetical protein
MMNRIASLFELDDLLQVVRHGHSNGSARHSPKKKRAAKVATHAPATRAPATPARTGAVRPANGEQTVTSHSFDTGAPVRCAHDVAYPAVPRVEVEGPSQAADAASAQQFSSDQYDVEAFEEPDPEPYGDEPPETPYAPSDRDDSSHQASWTPARPTSFSAPAARPTASPTFAAQMSAVENDLADLAARATVPPETPASGPISDAGDAAARESPADGQPRASGHALFDQMATGMGYSTEFRLPPVQLSQVFSALDKQLDADGQRESPAVVVPAAPAVATAPPSAPISPIEPITSATLLQDLVAIPDHRTDNARNAVSGTAHD